MPWKERLAANGASGMELSARKSRLPISRKRPWGLSRRRLRIWPSPARELRTTSTPWPSVSCRTCSANSRLRESRTCSTPSRRTRSRLAGVPAVAMIRAPASWANWIAARPTPPAPAWISTVSPAVNRATWPRAWWTVRKQIGRVAAAVRAMPSGTCSARSARTVTWDPMQPLASAAIRSPGVKAVTPAPTAVTVPANSRPMSMAEGSPSGSMPGGTRPVAISTSR